MPNLNMPIILESTLQLAKQYGSDLIQGTISDERLDELVKSIHSTFKTEKGNRKLNPFSADCYSQSEGVENFIQYLAPDLSEKNLYVLIEKLSDIQGANIRFEPASLLKPLLILETKNKLKAKKIDDEKNTLQTLKDMLTQALHQMIPNHRKAPTLDQLQLMKAHPDFKKLQEKFLQALQLPDTIKKLYQEKFVSIVATKNLSLGSYITEGKNLFDHQGFVHSFGDNPYFNIIKPILTHLFDNEIDRQYVGLLLAAFENDHLKEYCAKQIQEYDATKLITLQEFSEQETQEKIEAMLNTTNHLHQEKKSKKERTTESPVKKSKQEENPEPVKNRSKSFSFKKFSLTKSISQIFSSTNENEPKKPETPIIIQHKHRHTTFTKKKNPFLLQDPRKIVEQYDHEITLLKNAQDIYTKNYEFSIQKSEKDLKNQLEFQQIQPMEQDVLSPSIIQQLTLSKKRLTEACITDIQKELYPHLSTEEVAKNMGDITKFEEKIKTLENARDQINQKFNLQPQQSTEHKPK